jgi:hypothetical protein
VRILGEKIHESMCSSFMRTDTLFVRTGRCALRVASLLQRIGMGDGKDFKEMWVLQDAIWDEV